MKNLNNLGILEPDYFTEETNKLIKSCESEAFRDTYYVSETTLVRIRNPQDKSRYKNLINNKYIWLRFKI